MERIKLHLINMDLTAKTATHYMSTVTNAHKYVTQVQADMHTNIYKHNSTFVINTIK